MACREQVHFLEPNLPVHTFTTDEEGPTALIQAGIHGNEIAGVHALRELLEEDFRPQRGKLLLVPVMNPPAYRARMRYTTGGLDLNRCFPGSPGAEDREHRLAHAFMEIVRAEQPVLVATLHESERRYHPQVPRSFGQTLIHTAPETPKIVSRVVERLNGDLADDYELWAPHHFPVPTASSDVLEATFGCLALCVETWIGFSESRRVEMQREVVIALLSELGLID